MNKSYLQYIVLTYVRHLINEIKMISSDFPIRIRKNIPFRLILSLCKRSVIRIESKYQFDLWV